jgi:hypothetical protein
MFTMILLVCGSRWGVDKGSPPSLDAIGALPERDTDAQEIASGFREHGVLCHFRGGEEP